ncbi:MAG: DUF2635 domain-containing protein [Planctomycetota bacterium]
MSDPTHIRVRPLPGRLVRDPITRVAVPEQGAEVADATFWRRRALAGDVEIVRGDAVAKSKRKPKEA